MARDFSDLYDFGTMSDDEIYDVVMQHLGEYPELDMGWIEVAVNDGHVVLSGRVGSDGEAQVAEKTLVEVLGLERLTNELVVDELHRGGAPEAADDAAMLDRESDSQLGDPNDQQSDTAAHLVEDLDAQAFGTHDMGAAIQDGASYNPPDRAIPDGYTSRENH